MKKISRAHLRLILKELITEQSVGEWTDEIIEEDTNTFLERLSRELEIDE